MDRSEKVVVSEALLIFKLEATRNLSFKLVVGLELLRATIKRPCGSKLFERGLSPVLAGSLLVVNHTVGTCSCLGNQVEGSTDRF